MRGLFFVDCGGIVIEPTFKMMYAKTRLVPTLVAIFCNTAAVISVSVAVGCYSQVP